MELSFSLNFLTILTAPVLSGTSLQKNYKEEKFMNKKRKFSILIITMMIIMAIAYYHGTDKAVAADNTFNYANGKYIITNDTQLEVQFAGVSKKSVSSVEIPATIKINEQVYKVTGVKANALKDNKKVKKLTVGENVRVIGKKAFYGCKNLKSITIIAIQ